MDPQILLKRQIFEFCKKNETHWKFAENQLQCANHEILGEISCIFWSLPTFAMRAAVNHHRSKAFDLERKYMQTVTIVAFTNQAAHWLLCEPYRIDHFVFENSYKTLGFPEIFNHFLEGLLIFRDIVIKILDS